MKFGVVRNVAGNIEALRDADRLFDRSGVEFRVCLGQIMGIYPYVDDCVRLLVQKKYFALRQLIDNEFTTGCHFVGWSKVYLVNAVKFARNLVSNETLAFIGNLPTNLEIEGVGFQGLAPGDNYLYEFNHVLSAFASWPQRTVIHAAESDPYVWRENCSRTALSQGLNQLDRDGRLLISTGGVGSMYEGSLNTGEPAALVYDDANRTAEIVRPRCDVMAIFDQLRATDYPHETLAHMENREYRAWRK